MRLMAAVTTPAPSPSPKVTAEPVTSSPSESVVRKTTAKDFVFELKEVKRSGTALSFQLLITNTGQDREITLYFKGTRIFDEAGNEYAPTKIQIGNKTVSRSGVSNLLVSGIPVRAILNFEKVFEQASKITLLEMKCNSGGHFRAQIRDIPIPQ